MRLKKTPISESIKERRFAGKFYTSNFDIERHKFTINFMNTVSGFDRLQCYLVSSNSNGGLSKYEYIHVSYTESWISIQSVSRSPLNDPIRGTYRLSYSVNWKLIINKSNLSKSFLKSTSCGVNGAINSLLRAVKFNKRLARLLNLDLVPIVVIKSAIRLGGIKVLQQLIRGYINTPSDLLKYSIELAGLKGVKSYNKIFKLLTSDKFNSIGNLESCIKSVVHLLKSCKSPEGIVNDPATLEYLIMNAFTITEDYSLELLALDRKHSGTSIESIKLGHSKLSAILAEEKLKYSQAKFDTSFMPTIEDDNFRILKTEIDFYNEGKEMDHCVYTSTYFESMKMGKTLILSYNKDGVRGTVQLTGVIARDSDLQLHDVGNDVIVDICINQFYGPGNTELDKIHHNELYAYLDKHRELLVNYFESERLKWLEYSRSKEAMLGGMSVPNRCERALEDQYYGRENQVARVNDYDPF